MRAHSAFYSEVVLHTAVTLEVRFSVTARQDERIRVAIDAIDEADWQPTSAGRPRGGRFARLSP